jgi:hypothetical protein
MAVTDAMADWPQAATPPLERSTNASYPILERAPTCFKTTRPARELYRMNANGSETTRPTNNQVNHDWPTWSPGSDKVAFASDRSGTVEIYLMNPTGSGVTGFTTNSAFNGEPA